VQQVKCENANGYTKTKISLLNIFLNCPGYCLALLHYRMTEQECLILFLQEEDKILLFHSPDKTF